MEEERKTDIWQLYEIGKNYNRLQNMYVEGRENYNYYRGDQWEGLQRPKESSEPIVLNIVKPIIKYKTNIVNQRAYDIVFNPNTYSTPEELEMLRAVTKGLNQFVMKAWEKSQSGKKVRNIVKTAAINSEGIMYFYYKDDEIISEEIDKNNIYYGNENEPDIERQPYILVTQRVTVQEARDMARYYREQGKNNLTDEEIETIVSDNDYEEQQGKDKMTVEVSPMCLIIQKFEKKDGKLAISCSSKTCDIYKEETTDCERYPFAHYIWEDIPGSARGTSEVNALKPNQREINKTATRRAISVKIGAYPKIVYDKERISNPESLEQVGSKIELTDMRADDVNKVITYLRPAQMSPDAYNLQQDLITGTRELAGAGDTVTGNVDPTQASGRAILAVQQAAQMPIQDQVENYKYFLEDCGKILFDLMKVYYVEGITLYTDENTIDDQGQTETVQQPFTISQEQLSKLNVSLKIDITPQSPYDKLVAINVLQEMLNNGQITLEEFVKALPDDSAEPKQELETVLRERREARKLINEMQQQMNAYNSAINQAIIEQGGDPGAMSDMQASGNASPLPEGQQDNVQM